MSDYKFANATAALFDADGLSWRVREGDTWEAEDPLVKLHPEFFSDEPPKVLRSVPTQEQHEARYGKAPIVEQATAAPGEQRGKVNR